MCACTRAGGAAARQLLAGGCVSTRVYKHIRSFFFLRKSLCSEIELSRRYVCTCQDWQRDEE